MDPVLFSSKKMDWCTPKGVFAALNDEFNFVLDAAEPLGFLVKRGEEVLFFATDTVNLNVYADDVTIYALEANFDREILELSEHVPDKVKERTTRSHMEIGVLCEYIKKCDLSKCREVHLLHLSAACSNERWFVRRVSELCGGIPVTACGI